MLHLVMTPLCAASGWPAAATMTKASLAMRSVATRADGSEPASAKLARPSITGWTVAPSASTEAQRRRGEVLAELLGDLGAGDEDLLRRDPRRGDLQSS